MRQVGFFEGLLAWLFISNITQKLLREEEYGQRKNPLNYVQIWNFFIKITKLGHWPWQRMFLCHALAKDFF